MSKIKLFVRQAFSFYKRDFYILILSNIVLGIFLKILDANPVFEGSAIIFMFFKNLTFIRSASIMPSVSSDFDRFSWKYYQGLPLNKKENILSLALSNFIVMLPLLSFVIVFSSQIGDIFIDEGEILTFPTKVKYLLVTLPVLILIGFFSIRNLITLPRTQYSRLDSKIILYQAVKCFSIVLAVMLYGVYFLSLVLEYTGIAFLKYIWEIVVNIYNVLGSWWAVPGALIMMIVSYKWVILAWQNEKIGYLENKWKTSRDVSIIGTCITLTLGLTYYLEIGTPEEYKGTPLLKTVYSRDSNQIKELLKEGHNINQSNKYGFSPIMVAAAIGDFNLFQLLLKNKATLNGEVKKGMNIFLMAVLGRNEHIVNYLLGQGFHPDEINKQDKRSALHLAAGNCDTKMIDYLVKKKAMINVLNQKGQSPLHLAAKRRCFGTIVSLIESGADPLIKDKEGKLALDYIEKEKYKSKELAYYLEKRSRGPASK